MKKNHVTTAIVISVLLLSLSVFAVVFSVPLLFWFGSVVREPQPLVMHHHVTIPATNHYSLTGQTKIRSSLDSRRARGDIPPAAVLEHSSDGITFQRFPMVSYSTFSNTMGIREINVGGTDVWIRLTTTNQADIGRSVSLVFIGEVR